MNKKEIMERIGEIEDAVEKGAGYETAMYNLKRLELEMVAEEHEKNMEFLNERISTERLLQKGIENQAAEGTGTDEDMYSGD